MKHDPFREWMRNLTYEQVMETRREHGVSASDSSRDVEIGMNLNALRAETLFQGIGSVSPAFVPERSRLAAAIAPEKEGPRLELGSNGSRFSDEQMNRLVECLEEGAARGGIPPKLLGLRTVHKTTGVGMSEYQFKPGVGLPDPVTITWDEAKLKELDNVQRAFSRACAPDVDRTIRQLMNIANGHKPFEPDYLKSITHATSLINLPAKSVDEVIKELSDFRGLIEEMNAAERARQLTNAQIIQLCGYFHLYTIEAIVEFIKEHQR